MFYVLVNMGVGGMQKFACETFERAQLVCRTADRKGYRYCLAFQG